MTTEVEGIQLYGTVHMDKKPLSLIHTCDNLIEGPPRYRIYAKYNKTQKKVLRAKFRLDQPNVAATYRNYFWGVDRYNKLSLGPGSLQYAVRVLDWKKRFFFALMGMCECNAYLAYN